MQWGLIAEHEYYRLAAFEMGLEFADKTPEQKEPLFNVPSPNLMREMTQMVATRRSSARRKRLFHLVPDLRNVHHMKAFVRSNGDIAGQLRVTTRRANEEAIERRCSKSLSHQAKNRLLDIFPNLSARWVITAQQAIFLFVTLQALVSLALFANAPVLLSLHLVATGFYLGCTGLRLMAAWTFAPKASLYDARAPGARSHDHALPVYSVLVALYDEANQVDDLVDALMKLDWPAEKLDIKLICEADDDATIHAAEAALARVKRSCFSIVKVPPDLPRTKPKALNYALPLARGDLLVVYDAEDRPHQHQLREAHAVFQTGEDSLICLQSPLIVHNHNGGWLARMFAIEYCALFDGLLPMLSRAKTMLPLGGTSNHFKREVFQTLGGWDPYNVTEDADLGVRIARAGYRIESLALPTFEEAPTTFLVWLRQRTRWFKGWIQTWLVHMRNPLLAMRELGVKGSITFHLMVTGMIVCSLIHPILLYLIGSWGVSAVQNGFSVMQQHPLIILDAVTILGGYIAFAALALRTLPLRGMAGLRASLWTLPAYWMLLSIAAWRAVWHLITRPHEWEKTPHNLSSRVQAASDSPSTP